MSKNKNISSGVLDRAHLGSAVGSRTAFLHVVGCFHAAFALQPPRDAALRRLELAELPRICCYWEAKREEGQELREA